jgi:hypothetical protein
MFHLTQVDDESSWIKFKVGKSKGWKRAGVIVIAFLYILGRVGPVEEVRAGEIRFC